MTPNGDPVRLVLVDDHEMVIEGLKAMLAAFDDRVQVVGQAVGAERALSVIDEHDPDIVLCDVRMQGSSGLDLCLELREKDPKRKVVMLSVYDDEQYLFQALRVGASGYLLKSISSDELVRQLEFVQGGDLGFHGRALGEQQLADLVEVPAVGRDRLGEIEQRHRQPPIIPWRHQFWMIASEDSTPGRLNP